MTKPKTQSIDYAKRDLAIHEVQENFLVDLGKNAAHTRMKIVEKVFLRCQDPVALTWAEHGELVTVLGDIRARDGLLRKLHDEPKSRVATQGHLVRELEQAQEVSVACLATVIAGIAWLDGDGALAAGMVARGLAADSSYSLAQLLDIALRHNVPSYIWSQSLEAVSYEACIAGAA
jgi:hypothetical protein